MTKLVRETRLPTVEGKGFRTELLASELVGSLEYGS